MTAGFVHVHAFATLAMVGLIWTIQVVHYPLFAMVPSDAFGAYEKSHMLRITWLVGPLMLIEAVTAALLFAVRPTGVPMWMIVAGFLLVVGLWVMTATMQGPAHTKMAANGFDSAIHRQLVDSNWWRTFGWTARGVLALAMVHLHAAAIAGIERGVAS